MNIAICPAFAYEPQFTDNTKTIRLHWRSEFINLTLSNSLRQPAANIKPNSDIVGALRSSLKAWEAVTNVKFVTVWSDKVSISQSEGNGDGASLITIAATPENVAPFQGDSGEMFGRTRTFYDRRGNITEADIVLNPYQQFSTDGTFGTFDLEAALTHEIGHLLGLDHSAVLAATMYAQQGKNGTFSLSAFAPRSLAEDDRAGIRSLYGAKIENETCCGAVTGILTSFNGKQLANWQVWTEDIVTGKLFAEVATNDTGAWNIGGLPNGKYRVVAQAEKFNSETLGEIVIEADKTTILNYKLAPRAHLFDSLLLGFNGQLSPLPVPLNTGGHWQTVFLGGKNINVVSLGAGALTASSPYLQISSESLTKQDFDTTFNVASFNIHLTPDSPPGEYNLHIQYLSGETIYLLGCFTVDQN
ncbi:MAG: matrixin family metalloprotease [Pyrinomonadaceae bacterium]